MFDLEKEAPRTYGNKRAWMNMMEDGMSAKDAFEAMADWAAMLECHVSEIDPNYLFHSWGLCKNGGFVSHISA